MAQITLNSSGVASSGSLLLQTNGTTTQATVDTSGNLGLGVTPSAWATFKVMQIGNGTADTFIAVSGNQGDFGVNAYYNAGWKYQTSSVAASRYEQSSGVHQWFNAPSGTAGNAISFTQAMTLNASGNLGIGTTSPGTRLHAVGTASFDPLRLESTVSGYERSWTIGPNVGTNGVFAIRDSTSGQNVLNIDTSGNLLVGTTSATYVANGIRLNPTQDGGNLNIGHPSGTASGTVFAGFGYNGTAIGYIGQSGTTAVTYNTTSDYRLKENVQPLSGALAKVAALKPCTYTWKSSPNEIGEGFIAHELQEVCPQAVTGEKDAVDENGNPKYQGIDTSFLVATLTAAIKEQQAIITQLQADVAALKGQA